MKEIERRIADVIATHPRPEQPAALVELGEGFLLRTEPDAAQKCFDKALQIDPRCTDAWIGRAVILVAKGQKGQAIGCLDRALDVNPEHEDAKQRKEKILKEMALASSKNRRYIEPDPPPPPKPPPPPPSPPPPPPARETPVPETPAPKTPVPEAPPPSSVPELAAAPKSEPKPEPTEALDDVDLAEPPRSQRDPAYEDASILFSAGKYIDSLRKVEPLTKQKEVAVEVWMLRGKICAALTQADAAIESFEKATKAAPTFVPAWIELAKANLEARRYERALAVSDKAVKTAPTDSDLHKLRGQALLALKRPGEAVTALEHACKNAPDDAEALLELAHALGSLSKKDEAREKAKRALALAETMKPDVVAAIEELLTKLG